MATSKSIISVAILGDAKSLVAAVNTAEGRLKGFGKKLALGVGGIVAVDKVFDVIGDSLENADKFADALDRIKGLSGGAFADKIGDIAFSMSNIGLSAPEVADLAASFDSFATSAGVSQPLIQDITPDLVAIAAAVAATTGKTVDEVIGDIGRAAAGNKKSVADLGIVIDGTLNPDAQILSILDQLKTKFPDVVSATGDLAGKQDALNAKWDNATTKLGLLVEGPMAAVLDWFIQVIDNDIPSAITGFSMLNDALGRFGDDTLGGLITVRDLLNDIVKTLPLVGGGFPGGTGGVGNAGKFAPRPSERPVIDSERHFTDRNGTGDARGRIGGP